MVDSDGVGSESLHERGIPLALFALRQRVIWGELVCNAYANCKYNLSNGAIPEHTLDEPLIAIAGKELGAFCGDCGKGCRD